MNLKKWRDVLKGFFGRGTCPYQLSFILSSFLRRFILTPEALAERLHVKKTCGKLWTWQELHRELQKTGKQAICRVASQHVRRGCPSMRAVKATRLIHGGFFVVKCS